MKLFYNLAKNITLPFHINELKLFLSLLTVKYDIISKFESRITKNNSLVTNIHIPGYSVEYTPTESIAGATYYTPHTHYTPQTHLLYTSDTLTIHLRHTYYTPQTHLLYTSDTISISYKMT